jgi:hypothetical protein
MFSPVPNREEDMRKTLLAGWLALSVAASPAWAQKPPGAGKTAAGDTAADAPALASGNKVRITAPQFGTEPIVATVAGFVGDTLVLATDERGTHYLAVPVRSITKLELSRGKAAGLTIAGAAIGLLVGGVVGAAIATAGEDERPRQGWPVGDVTIGEEGLADATGVLLGGVAGAFLGAMIGHSLSSERWTTITLRGGNVAVTPWRGVSVRVTLPSPM